MPTTEYENDLPRSDIRYWFVAVGGVCPNCGLDLKTVHPLYNIYPHWAGSCERAAPRSGERKGE